MQAPCQPQNKDSNSVVRMQHFWRQSNACIPETKEKSQWEALATRGTQGPDVAHERFEGISSPSSASGAGISHVIGLGIEQSAPAVAALSGREVNIEH